jgi:hypothetical protein
MKRRYSNFYDQKITPYDEPQPVDPSTSGGSQTKPTPQPTGTSNPSWGTDPYSIGIYGTDWKWIDSTLTYVDQNGQEQALMVNDPIMSGLIAIAKDPNQPQENTDSAQKLSISQSSSQTSSTPSEQKTPWKVIGLATALIITAFIIYKTL